MRGVGPLRALLYASCLGIAPAACGGPEIADAVTVELTMTPAQPAVDADTLARVTLRDAAQQPVRGATLQIEGHMSHPGMAPVITRAVERGDGVYEAQVRFTMHGDWILLVTGELADGRRIERRIDVATERPPG